MTVNRSFYLLCLYRHVRHGKPPHYDNGFRVQRLGGSTGLHPDIRYLMDRTRLTLINHRNKDLFEFKRTDSKPEKFDKRRTRPWHTVIDNLVTFLQSLLLDIFFKGAQDPRNTMKYFFCGHYRSTL